MSDDQSRRRRARPRDIPAPLGEEEKRWLVGHIARVVDTSEPRFEAVARRLVTDLLRRWTSDGVVASAVCIEALWTEFDRLPHTRLARVEGEAWLRSGRRGRRPFVHEHIVPCQVLRSWIFSARPGAEELYVVLDRHCVAALVHRLEERALRPFRSSMPTGWQLTATSDPWARYKAVSFNGATLFELVAATCPATRSQS